MTGLEWNTEMVRVYVTSAFCTEEGGGNKAGIVFDRPDLSEDAMKEIARRMGFSETVFITESEKADFRFRYFTPADEVELCGHATIAAFYTMWKLGGLDRQEYTIETKAGILNIKMDENDFVFMEQNLPEFFETYEEDVFAECLGSGVKAPGLMIQAVSTGLKDIMFPVRSKEALSLIRPDFEKMAALNREQGVVGIHAFALTGEKEPVAICRNFAPLYGIDEESATGTSNCALAGYLFRYYKKQETYVFEQGYNLGNPSRIIVKLNIIDDSVDSVYVGGTGKLLGSKDIDI